MSSKKQLIGFSIVFIVLFLATTTYVAGCDLTWHDWDIFASKRVKLDSSVLPLAEISYLSVIDELKASEAIVWKIPENFSRLLLLPAKLIITNWVTQADWYVGQLPEEYAQKSAVYLSSHETEVTAALMTDTNSYGSCYQIVFMQRSTVRVAQPRPEKPFVEEFAGIAWVAIVFHSLPTPENIMSITIYPVSQKQKLLYSNETLVRNLISQGVLKPRTPDFINIYDYGFPEP